MSLSLIDTLRHCELLETLSDAEIRPIEPLCTRELYDAGETLCRQGEQGTRLYVILDGQITLERSVDLGDRTATVSICTWGKGRELGCWLALLGERHTLMATAVCNKQTEVLSLEGAALRAVLERNPRTGFKVLEKPAFTLGERLRGVYGALELV